MTNSVPSPEEFSRQLKETIAWCAPRVDASQPRLCLRSRELRPDLVRHYETESRVQRIAKVQVAMAPKLATEHGPEEWIWLTPALISPVVRRRHEMLAISVDTPRSDDVLGGRLLLSFYEYTDHDGATAYETAGYLDFNDVPPWDTWVGDVPCVRATPPRMKSIHTVFGGENIDRILVAWVPETFVSMIDAAIKTEAMGMLAWSDDLPGEERAFGVWREVVPAWLRGPPP